MELIPTTDPISLLESGQIQAIYAHPNDLMISLYHTSQPVKFGLLIARGPERAKTLSVRESQKIFGFTPGWSNRDDAIAFTCKVLRAICEAGSELEEETNPMTSAHITWIKTELEKTNTANTWEYEN